MNISPLQLKNKKGFVILFAILVSSLILLISAGIFSLVQKEVILSSSARESQRAFYAADSALECALFSDLVGIDSPPRTPFIINPVGAQADSFECGGDTIDSSHIGDTDEYDFAYVIRYYNNLDDLNNQNNSCAYVLIEKNLKTTDTTVVETRITAVGFNVCTSGNATEFSGQINIPDFDDPTLLERRLSISYNN
jgi:hypothetical protein